MVQIADRRHGDIDFLSGDVFTVSGHMGRVFSLMAFLQMLSTPGVYQFQ